jgi:hypothetical protein
MHWETHSRITEAVCEALRLPKQVTSILREGSIAPDYAPDYEYRVVTTAKGKTVIRRVRVKHHGTPRWLIKKYVTDARRLVLKAARAPPMQEAGVLRKIFGLTREHMLIKAYRKLGRALHYIQDNVVVGPDTNKALHDKIERECRRLDPRDFVEVVEAPVGKLATYKEIESVKPYDNALDAMRMAVKHSLAVASSVLSPPEAPPDLNKLANEAYRYFKTVRVPLATISSLPLIISLVLLVEISPFALVVLFLSFYLMLLGLLVALRRDINSVLASAQRMHSTLKALSVSAALLSLSLWNGLFLAPILPATLLYFAFLRFKAWREIKDEVDWFIWVLESGQKRLIPVKVR